MAARAIRTKQTYLKDGVEMAISKGSTLGLPLGGPQHGREIESRVDDDAISIGDLKKSLCLPVKNVRKVIATCKYPSLQIVALGDLITERQRVIHIDSGGREHRWMCCENGANPLAKLHSSVSITLLARQQMQKPE